MIGPYVATRMWEVPDMGGLCVVYYRMYVPIGPCHTLLLMHRIASYGTMTLLCHSWQFCASSERDIMGGKDWQVQHIFDGSGQTSTCHRCIVTLLSPHPPQLRAMGMNNGGRGQQQLLRQRWLTTTAVGMDNSSGEH
jgi:hypothetical protein